MINEEYKSLWDKNDSRTFMVLRVDDEQEYGTVVVAPDQDPNALLEQAKKLGTYPQDSYLVEIVEDFDNLAEGTDIN